MTEYVATFRKYNTPFVFFSQKVSFLSKTLFRHTLDLIQTYSIHQSVRYLNFVEIEAGFLLLHSIKHPILFQGLGEFSVSLLPATASVHKNVHRRS